MFGITVLFTHEDHRCHLEIFKDLTKPEDPARLCVQYAITESSLGQVSIDTWRQGEDYSDQDGC